MTSTEPRRTATDQPAPAATPRPHRVALGRPLGHPLGAGGRVPAPAPALLGTAVVTGGTRGVGLAVARRLGAAGHDVVLTYGRDDATAGDAVQHLREHGVRATPVRADLTGAGAMDAILDLVENRGERLAVVVHNAASYTPASTLGASFADFCAEASVSLAPLVDGAARIARLMDGGPGRIVTITSMGTYRAVPQYVHLGMAKAAVESYVRYLAVELAPRGVTVNAVSTAKIDKSAGQALSAASEHLARRTPAGRLTTVDDVADAVALLCSPLAGWIHGQVITADGGLSLIV